MEYLEAQWKRKYLIFLGISRIFDFGGTMNPYIYIYIYIHIYIWAYCMWCIAIYYIRYMNLNVGPWLSLLISHMYSGAARIGLHLIYLSIYIYISYIKFAKHHQPLHPFQSDRLDDDAIACKSKRIPQYCRPGYVFWTAPQAMVKFNHSNGLRTHNQYQPNTIYRYFHFEWMEHT